MDGSSPKKAPSSTPKKHSEMTEEEKKAEKAKKFVTCWWICNFGCSEYFVNLTCIEFMVIYMYAL